jgi:hypothetical protein
MHKYQREIDAFADTYCSEKGPTYTYHNGYFMEGFENSTTTTTDSR